MSTRLAPSFLIGLVFAASALLATPTLPVAVVGALFVGAFSYAGHAATGNRWWVLAASLSALAFGLTLPLARHHAPALYEVASAVGLELLCGLLAGFAVLTASRGSAAERMHGLFLGLLPLDVVLVVIAWTESDRPLVPALALGAIVLGKLAYLGAGRLVARTTPVASPFRHEGSYRVAPMPRMFRTDPGAEVRSLRRAYVFSHFIGAGIVAALSGFGFAALQLAR